MSVTYDAPAAGEEMVYQNVAQIIDGLTGVTSVAHLMVNDHATNPALTVKSTHATGPAFRVLDNSGNQTVNVALLASNDNPALIFETMEFKNNAKISMRSDGAVPRSTMFFDMYRDDSSTGTVFFQNIYDNRYSAGGIADVANAALIGRQMAGDSYFRTVEIDMLNMTGGATWPHLGIELSIESGIAGNGSDETVGIAIHNLGSTWGVPTPQPIDTGLLVGRDDERITNFIRCMGSTADGNKATVLFNIDYTGLTKSGHHHPMIDSSYDLGTTALNWRAAYVENFVSTFGINATAVHYSLGATGTGLGLPASNAIGIFNAATETIRITSAGLLDFRNAQIVSPGGGAGAALSTIGGSGPTVGTQAAWLKILNGGAAHFVPTWQ